MASTGHSLAQVPQAMHSSVILYAMLITSLQIFNLLYHTNNKLQQSVWDESVKKSKKEGKRLPLTDPFFPTGDPWQYGKKGG
jgi:hypothetical protein